MDRSIFFNRVRRSRFGGSLTQAQVDGCNVLLNACARHGVTNSHHVANILAQVSHETGGYMLPIKETVYASHANKNPSDATVIRRLDKAWASGKLPWVKSPYWRAGWFGRGQIQITFERNYRKLGNRLKINLVGNRDMALNPDISADIAVVGMSEGLFTGKSLNDYSFPNALDASWKYNPRRIVNGKDGTDKKIAGYHRAFFEAIKAAGGAPTLVDRTATPDVVPEPTPRIDAPDDEVTIRPDVGGVPNDSVRVDKIDPEVAAAAAAVTAGSATAASGHPIIGGFVFVALLIGLAGFILHRRGHLKPLIRKVKSWF